MSALVFVLVPRLGFEAFPEGIAGSRFSSSLQQFLKPRDGFKKLVPRLGFEPRFPGPEPGVLPLDDLGLSST